MKVACIQLGCGSDIQENLNVCGGLIRKAAEQGAIFIATPEVTDRVLPPKIDRLEKALPESEHPGIPFFADLARELGVALLIGSMTIKRDADKLLNRSYLFSKDGQKIAHYDKIHLYDAVLQCGEAHKESNYYAPGDRAVVADIDNAKIGMSICYDLRFAYLFRDLAHAGADILTIPAAFTVPTGKAHWEVLMRARAIETGCFVMAPAQTGDHQGARKTYGHSLIINPWGEIIAQAGTDVGFIMADLSLDEIHGARGAIASLIHDRDYQKP